MAAKWLDTRGDYRYPGRLHTGIFGLCGFGGKSPAPDLAADRRSLDRLALLVRPESRQVPETNHKQSIITIDLVNRTECILCV